MRNSLILTLSIFLLAGSVTLTTLGYHGNKAPSADTAVTLEVSPSPSPVATPSPTPTATPTTVTTGSCPETMTQPTRKTFQNASAKIKFDYIDNWTVDTQLPDILIRDPQNAEKAKQDETAAATVLITTRASVIQAAEDNDIQATDIKGIVTNDPAIKKDTIEVFKIGSMHGYGALGNADGSDYYAVSLEHNGKYYYLAFDQPKDKWSDGQKWICKTFAAT